MYVCNFVQHPRMEESPPAAKVDGIMVFILLPPLPTSTQFVRGIEMNNFHENLSPNFNDSSSLSTGHGLSRMA